MAILPYTKMPDTDELTFQKGDIFFIHNDLVSENKHPRSLIEYAKNNSLAILQKAVIIVIHVDLYIKIVF